MGVVEGDTLPQSLQRQGTVHGARFKVQKAEDKRKMGGNSTFAGTGRTIDGDHGALSFRLPVNAGRGRIVNFQNP